LSELVFVVTVLASLVVRIAFLGFSWLLNLAESFGKAFKLNFLSLMFSVRGLVTSRAWRLNGPLCQPFAAKGIDQIPRKMLVSMSLFLAHFITLNVLLCSFGSRTLLKQEVTA
jgi:hypothetical protein